MAVRIAGPHGAQRQSETLGFGIPTPGERVHLAALVARDLGHDVGRGAEAVDAEPSRIARHAQRAVPDEPGAQERRGLDVGNAGREGEAKARIGQGVLGVAAVLPVARESGRVAEVLGAPLAIATGPAGGPEPRHPHAIAQSEPGHQRPEGRDVTDDLMSQDERQLGIGQLPARHVQIGAAHPAGPDAHQDLTGSRLGERDVREGQRRAGGAEDHGAHRLGAPSEPTPPRPAAHPAHRDKRDTPTR